MNLIVATEVDSEHPLAKAIMEHAKKRRVDEGNLTWPEAKSFVSITGHGVKAIVCCKEIIVGNENLRLDQNFAVPVGTSFVLSIFGSVPVRGITE